MAKAEISSKEYEQIVKKLNELKKTEEELRRTKDILAEAQRIANLGNWYWDIVNNTLEWSDEIYRIFGLKPQEFGATYEAFLNSVHPDDQDFVKTSVNEALEHDKPYSIDHRIVLPDGTVRTVHEQAEVFFGKDGKPIRMLGTVQDITERKQMEEALRINEENFRTVADFTYDWEYWIAPDGNYIYVSPSCERIIGYQASEFLQDSKFIETIIHPDDTIKFTKHIREELNIDKAVQINFRVITSTGDERWIDHICQRVYSSDNVWRGRRASNRDITERKKAEQLIIRQNALLNAINLVFQETLRSERLKDVANTCLTVAEGLTGSNFGFIGEINQAGRFDTIAISNPGWDACKMPESEATKLIKNMELRGIWSIVLKDEKTHLINDPKSHPASVGVPVGHPKITSFLGVPLKHLGKTFGVLSLGNKESGYDQYDQEAVEALSVAIVEAIMRKRAELELNRYQIHLEELVKERTLELEQSNELTELLLDSLPFPTMLISKNRTILHANQIAREIGAKIGEFCWKSFAQSAYIPEDDKDYFTQHGEIPPKGTHCHFCMADEVFKTQEPRAKIIEAWEKTWDAHWIPIDNEKYLHYTIDISERIEFEKLRRQFIYTVSHELRTPVSVISQSISNLQKYKEKLTPDQRDKVMSGLTRNATLLTEIIEDLLLVSRLDRETIRLNWKEYNLVDVLQDVLIQLEPRQKAKEIMIKQEVDGPIQLLGEKMRIAQIFRILIDNAIKYSSKNTKVEIRAEDHYQGEYNPIAIDGVLVQIIDEGRGIREEDIPNIFQRFFRAEDVSDIPGTGLGLSIAQELAQLHQGTTYVESSYGQGSTFFVFLPRLKAPPES